MCLDWAGEAKELIARVGKKELAGGVAKCIFVGLRDV